MQLKAATTKIVEKRNKTKNRNGLFTTDKN